MITRVVLGKLSPTMEEGTVVRWAKVEGETVQVGDVLAEIETDKANMEMEALGGGVLRKIVVPAGAKTTVGTLIGVVADPDEDITAVLSQPVSAPSPMAAPETASTPVADTPPPSPATPGRVRASPVARRLAAERNIVLESISGSGPGGRIVMRDVVTLPRGASTFPLPAARPTESATRAVFAPPVMPVVPGKPIPLSNMRRTIARRLTESKATAPHFYVTVEIDMGAAMALRQQLREGRDIRLSVNDLVVKACALALRLNPLVNAVWGPDAIVPQTDVHVGVAVALPDGLITPVIRNADSRSILEISRDVQDLAARAKQRRLRPEEYTGSTFTVSNLGMHDVIEFTAIINPPESAILAVGSVREIPVVQAGQLGVGKRMRVTLSADHRVVDGVLAAQFLSDLRKLLENPAGLLL